MTETQFGLALAITDSCAQAVSAKEAVVQAKTPRSQPQIGTQSEPAGVIALPSQTVVWTQVYLPSVVR